jgi:hypothetical protein
MAKKRAFWDTPAKPSGAKLTAKQKTAAKTRASRAGRRYPNLVDNAWAKKRGK